MKRAETLQEIRNVLLAGALTKEQLDGFYVEELRVARGEDFVTEFARDLREDAVAAPERRWFHRFLSGHPGVGKSTEFSRLEQILTGEFELVRLNAQTELNPALFHPMDLILALMTAAADHAAKCIGKRKVPADAATALVSALEWLGEEKVTSKVRQEAGIEGKAGVGPAPNSLIAEAFSFFFQLQADARYRVEDETLKIPHRVKPVREFIGHANAVFTACEKICRGTTRDQTAGQFLFLFDNFEKPEFDAEAVNKLFCEHSQILTDLRIHYVITMPVERANSTRIRQITLYQHGTRLVPDVPVYTPTFAEHTKGREALRRVLASRVDLGLFAAGEAERLIVASGGNVRDLFEMILKARSFAMNVSESAPRLEPAHVTAAIDERRTYYQRQLYSDKAADLEPATYQAKVARLGQFYRQEANVERDEVFYALLRARALQEFDDARVAVHPLVVDFLYREGLLADVSSDKRHPDGRPLGGTPDPSP